MGSYLVVTCTCPVILAQCIGKQTRHKNLPMMFQLVVVVLDKEFVPGILHLAIRNPFPNLLQDRAADWLQYLQETVKEGAQPHRTHHPLHQLLDCRIPVSRMNTDCASQLPALERRQERTRRRCTSSSSSSSCR